VSQAIDARPAPSEPNPASVQALAESATRKTAVSMKLFALYRASASRGTRSVSRAGRPTAKCAARCAICRRTTVVEAGKGGERGDTHGDAPATTPRAPPTPIRRTRGAVTKSCSRIASALTARSIRAKRAVRCPSPAPRADDLGFEK
jgi:hypothetical protein